jgi:cytochrome c oxidase subunit III
MRLWLLGTAMLGMTFVGGQVFEFTTFFHEGLTIKTNLFGTTFFTLTGFHGFHVFIGLVMLTILFGLALRGAFRGPHSSALESISYYWHFVDLVWVVVFSVVYLWTLFS